MLFRSGTKAFPVLQTPSCCWPHVLVPSPLRGTLGSSLRSPADATLLWLNQGGTDSPLPKAWLHRQHFTVAGPGDPRGRHSIPLYWGVRPQREQGDSPDHPAALKKVALGKVTVPFPLPPLSLWFSPFSVFQGTGLRGVLCSLPLLFW